MDYKSTIYKECLEIAEELIWEDYIRTEFPYWKRDRYDMSDVKENMLAQYSDLEKINIGQELLQIEIRKDKYNTDLAKQIDLEWLESFMEWREIYNEKLLAKSRVL